MTITVHYFAGIREDLGTSAEQLALPDNVATVGQLLAWLTTRHGAAGVRVLGQGRVLMAVNQQVARADAPVADGDEVAFFPPVTGG